MNEDEIALSTVRRRTDDLHLRMDRQEETMRAVEVSISRGNAALEVMKAEISHQAAMQSVQLTTVSDLGRLNAQKLDVMSRDIAAMGSDPQNTPAGRAVMSRIDSDRKTTEDNIQSLAQALESLTKSVEQTNRNVQDIAAWRTSVDTVIGLAKWMGFGNLVMFVYILLKTFKIVP